MNPLQKQFDCPHCGKPLLMIAPMPLNAAGKVEPPESPAPDLEGQEAPALAPEGQEDPAPASIYPEEPEPRLPIYFTGTAWALDRHYGRSLSTETGCVSCTQHFRPRPGDSAMLCSLASDLVGDRVYVQPDRICDNYDRIPRV